MKYLEKAVGWVEGVVGVVSVVKLKLSTVLLFVQVVALLSLFAAAASADVTGFILAPGPVVSESNPVPTTGYYDVCGESFHPRNVDYESYDYRPLGDVLSARDDYFALKNQYPELTLLSAAEVGGDPCNLEDATGGVFAVILAPSESSCTALKWFPVNPLLVDEAALREQCFQEVTKCGNAGALTASDLGERLPSCTAEVDAAGTVTLIPGALTVETALYDQFAVNESGNYILSGKCLTSFYEGGAPGIGLSSRQRLALRACNHGRLGSGKVKKYGPVSAKIRAISVMEGFQTTYTGRDGGFSVPTMLLDRGLASTALGATSDTRGIHPLAVFAGSQIAEQRAVISIISALSGASPTEVFADIPYTEFNPRSLSIEKLTLRLSLQQEGSDFVLDGATDLRQLAIERKFANLAVDTMRAHAGFLFSNPGRSLYGSPVPIVRSDALHGDTTRYYVESTTGSAGEQNRHRGLLQQIAEVDAADVHLYVYRSSDDSLIGVRYGAKEGQEVVGCDKDAPPLLADGSPDPFYCNEQVPKVCQSEVGPRGESWGCLLMTAFVRGPGSASPQYHESGELLDLEEVWQDTSGKHSEQQNASGLRRVHRGAGTYTLDQSYELSYPNKSGFAKSFLRVGDRAKIIALNRSSGYIAVTNAMVDGISSPELAGGGVSLMLPPNLKISVTRLRSLQQLGGSPRDDLQVVGFEGSGLISDKLIKIETVWVDQDGSSLPATLPGYTGRLTRLSGDSLCEDDCRADPGLGSGQWWFDIKPGRHTVVMRIPEQTITSGSSGTSAFSVDDAHYYIHVDGESRAGQPIFAVGRSADDPDFSLRSKTYQFDQDGTQNTVVDEKVNFPEYTVTDVEFPAGVDAGTDFDQDSIALNHRPADYVPFMVQVFDEDTTRKNALNLIRDAKGAGLSDYGAIKPVYNWLYRPEMQFTLLDLENFDADKADVTLTTDVDGTDYDINVRVSRPGEADGERQEGLVRFGEPRKVVWGLGWNELDALAVDSTEPLPPFEELLEQVPASQIASIGATVNSLSPADFLALQLYQDDDAGNLLAQYSGMPLVVTQVRPLELVRSTNPAEFPGTVAQGDATHVDSFERIRFELSRKANVRIEIVDVDGKVAEYTPLAVLEGGNKSNHYNLHVYYASVMLVAEAAGLNLKPSPAELTSASDELQPHAFLRIIATAGATQAGSATGLGLRHEVLFPLRLAADRKTRRLGELSSHGVRLQDGTLQLSRTDLSLSGVGPQIAFSRSYSNTGIAGPDQPMGVGWSHSLDMRLTPLAASTVNRVSLAETDPTEDGVPGWVDKVSAKIVTDQEVAEASGQDPSADAETQWVSVVANGTMFRLDGLDGWKAQVGRHGTLQGPSVAACAGASEMLPVPGNVVNGPDEGCFAYTAKDGTRYIYEVPPAPAGPRAPPTPRYLSVTDPLLYRLNSYDSDKCDSDGGVDEGVDGGVQPCVWGDSPAHDEPIKNALSLLSEEAAQTAEWPVRWGRLAAIVDRHDHEMSFEYDYDEPQLLKRVEDSTGRGGCLYYTQVSLETPGMPSVPGEGAVGTPITQLESRLAKFAAPVMTAACPVAGAPADTSVTGGPAVLAFAYDGEGAEGALDSAQRSTRIERYVYEPEGGEDSGELNLTSHYYDFSAGVASQATERVTYVYGVDALPSGLGNRFPALREDDLVTQVRYADEEGEAVYTFAYPSELTRTETSPRDANTTTYELDDAGHPKSITRPGGTATNYVWAPNGQSIELQSKTEDFGNGQTTTYEYLYDANGNVIEDAVVGDSTLTLSQSYFIGPDEFNLPRTTVDLYGVTTSYRNQNGKRTGWSLIDGAGTTDTTIVEHSSGSFAGLVQQEGPKGLGARLYSYGAYGNVKSVALPATSDGGGVTTLQLGRDGHGRQKSFTGPRGITQYRFNGLGKVDRVVAPALQYTADGKCDAASPSVTTFKTYDAAGHLLCETDRNGVALFYKYTPRGQVKTVFRAESGGCSGGGSGLARRFTYDLEGNLKTATDWREKTTSFEYDSLGHRRQTTNGVGVVTTEVHDSVGRLLSTEVGGVTTQSFVYDARGRVTSQTRNGGDVIGTQDTRYTATGKEESNWHGGVIAAKLDQWKYILGAGGRPISRASATGGIQSWQYGIDGKVSLAVDEDGVFTAFAHDARGQLQQRCNQGDTDAPPIGESCSGIVTSYAYDASGSLIETSWQAEVNGSPAPVAESTLYDSWGRPSLTTAPDGVKTRRTYDGVGNLLGVQDGNGEWACTVRNALGHVTSTTDRAGETTDYDVLDANGNPGTITGPEVTVSGIVYDALNRPTAMTRSGGGTSQNYSVIATDAFGNITNVNDWFGRIHLREFDALGRLTKDCTPGVSAECAVQKYHPNGQIWTQTDKRGNSTLFEYDSAGRQVAVADAMVQGAFSSPPASVRESNPVAYSGGSENYHSLRTVYTDAGRIKEKVDGRGGITSYAINADGRTDAMTVGDLTTDYGLDSSGQVISETNDLIGTREYQYDSAGRVKRLDYPGSVSQTFDYDNNGSRVGARWSSGLLTLNTYDKVGRPLCTKTYGSSSSVKDSSGTARIECQKYNAAGWVMSSASMGVETTYSAHDLLGRPGTIRVGDGNEVLETTVVEPMEYSGSTIVRKVTLPGDGEIEETYNTLGALMLRKSHGSETTYSVDEDGYVTHVSRLGGVELDYDFDARGQLLSITGGDADRSFAYDGNGNRVFARAQNGPNDDEITSEFDALGRQTAEQHSGSGANYGFAYNNATRTVNVSGNGTDYTETYDTLGRLTKLTESSTDVVFYTYEHDGRLKTVTTPNNTRSYSYHTSFGGAVKDIIVKDGASTLSEHRYDYDAAIRVARLNRSGTAVQNDATVYKYDTIGRLEVATQTASGVATMHEYAYRPAGYEITGYRKSVDGIGSELIGHTYGGTGLQNLVTEYDPSATLADVRADSATVQQQYTISYDNRGNLDGRLTGSGGENSRVFVYDALDQLSEVRTESGDVLAGYQYDADGMRIRTTGLRGSVETHRMGGQVAAEVLGGTTTRYRHGPSGMLAAAADSAVLSSGLAQWYQKDALGTTTLLTDNTGAAVRAYNPAPFGELQSELSADENRFVYTGHEHDVETGLTYMGARHYDPMLRTFLTQDPVHGFAGMPMTMSPYVYAANSPTNYVDPDGRVANLVAGGVAAVVGYAGTLAYQAYMGQELDHRMAAAVGLGLGVAVATAGAASAGLTGMFSAGGAAALSTTELAAIGGLSAGAATLYGGVAGELAATGKADIGKHASNATVAIVAGTIGSAVAAHAGGTAIANAAGGMIEGLLYGAGTGEDLTSPTMLFNLLGPSVTRTKIPRLSVEVPSGAIAKADVPVGGASRQAGTTRSAVGRRGKSRRMQAARAKAVAGREKGGGRRGGLTPHPADRVDLPGGHRGRYNAAAGHEGIDRLPTDYDVHHSIPQELRGDPRIAGIDIDSPLNTRGVRGSRSAPAGPGRNVHQHITNEWADFLTNSPNATRSDILNFRDNIDERFGFTFWENQQRAVKASFGGN